MRAAVGGQLAIDRRDDQATLAFGFLAEADGAGDLGQNCRLLRLTCLEQVGNPRQTAGDVAGLGAFLRIRAMTSPTSTWRRLPG
jgi:hypothetical protein